MAIYAIIGQSASGKSTIERLLEKMGISRIISYTTRPPRAGEVDGVDYHFISNIQYKSLEDIGFFSETARYRDWNYGLSLQEINYEKEDYVAVVTIHGYYEILKAVGEEQVVAIHIQTSERERMSRLVERGDEVDEIIRRIEADRIDFKDAEWVCDYVVNESTIHDSLVKVYNIISAK